MRLLLNIAFYVQGLQTKELVLYIVLCSFLVCCGFFSSNIHWSIYSVFSSVDSDTPILKAGSML